MYGDIKIAERRIIYLINTKKSPVLKRESVGMASAGNFSHFSHTIAQKALGNCNQFQFPDLLTYERTSRLTNDNFYFRRTAKAMEFQYWNWKWSEQRLSLEAQFSISSRNPIAFVEKNLRIVCVGMPRTKKMNRNILFAVSAAPDDRQRSMLRAWISAGNQIGRSIFILVSTERTHSIRSLLIQNYAVVFNWFKLPWVIWERADERRKKQWTVYEMRIFATS